MTRDAYLAIVTPGGDPGHALHLVNRAERDLKLIPVFQRDGLTILARPETRYHPLGHNGFAVGSLIPRGPDDARHDAAIGPANGHRLVASCWGDYVAFLCGTEPDSVTIIRAPSGGVPAFRASVGEVVLISSDVALLLALSEANPRIDWRFVAHHLTFPHLRAGATGLAGVDELFAGDGMVFTPQSPRRLGLWNPWDFAAAERQIVDAREARVAVREAVEDAVRGLVQPYRSALLELSGGLDSSVLAAALAASGTEASAINLVTPGTEGDERSYARATAAACGLGLAEREVAGDVDLTAPVSNRLARPGIPAILGPADGLLAGLARDSHVDVFISGTGGDCVFCSPASAAPAADAWRRFGPGRQFLRAARAIAEIHDTTLWTAGSMAWRQAHRPPIHRMWPGNQAFLVRDRLPREPDFHPWLVEPADALPGRRSHIRAVIAAFAHLDGYARHAVAPSIFPLMSQPVMEACFRIPTWMWIDGGRDRAVARQAFRDILPAKVLDRRSKGGMDAYCIRNFEANRSRLEPFLLDGYLAQADLLDRPLVASFLRKPVGSGDQRFYRLLPIIDTEVWARSWLGSPNPPDVR